MKKIATLAILLFLFIGIVGAVMPNPTYNFGPESGIKVKALEVTNDAQVKGNLYVNGTEVVNGAISSDTVIGSGYDIRWTGGNSLFDMSAATGVFKTSTGVFSNMAGLSRFESAINNFYGTALIGGATTMASAKVNTTLQTGGLATLANVWVPGAGTTLLGGALKAGGVTTIASGLVNSTLATGGLITAGGGLWVPSAQTTNIGTGAVKIGGAISANDVTVNSTKTLAVTSADKLTVGGVIVPQVLVVPVPMNNMTVGPIGGFYGMGSNYQVIGIVEKHQVANTNGITATIVKAPGTRALAASVNISTAAIPLSSATDTAQSPGISTTTGVALCNATDTIGVVLSGRALDYRGTIYLLMQRLA